MYRLISMLLTGALLLLGGCETVKGLGRDFQKAGQWMERSTQQDS